MSNRIQEINNAIVKLESFKIDSTYNKYAYAIEENIKFLTSIKSMPGYILWLIKKPSKLNPENLLELTDFPVEDWDIKMHSRLIQIERNKHIGLGKPLVDGIQKVIKENSKSLILVNLGAGGMETDRQVIANLIKTKNDTPFIFIGVDKSPVTHKIAYDNLKTLGEKVTINEIDHLDQSQLNNFQKNNRGILVILCKNDIFDLPKDFSPQFADLIYHSLFKHHIMNDQQKNLDLVMKKVSKKRLEYDGYRTWRVIIPQTIVAWKYPFFLAATVFSNLRFKTREELISSLKDKGNLSFYKGTGHYLMEYK